MINKGANMKNFQKIYPFTTEEINGYITKLDVQNKKVLTLGSSCDQALNSLLMGADVTVFDINEQVKNFYEFKRNLILTTPREELVDKVNDNKQFLYFNDIFPKSTLNRVNLYLQNDENYKKLRNILKEKNVDFIVGDIFNVTEYLDDNKIYDRVILSNVLDYIPINLNYEETIFNLYNNIINYLSDDALIELYYLYGSMLPKGFDKVIDKFFDYNIFLEKVSWNRGDAAIFVKKK